MKAGVRTLSVTDHDTMAAVPEVCEVGAAAGADVVPGIEMTAVSRGRDVHILGYFPSATPPGLEAFLTVQRRHRTQRLRAIASRLALLGAAVDVDALVATRGAGGQSLGRPAPGTGTRAGRPRSVDSGGVRSLARRRECGVGVPARGRRPNA